MLEFMDPRLRGDDEAEVQARFFNSLLQVLNRRLIVAP
jgi:hypothetical protein